METTSPIVPLFTSSLARAYEGWFAGVAPATRGTPAAVEAMTIRSTSSSVCAIGFSTAMALAPHSTAMHVRSARPFDVCGDGDNVERLAMQHLLGVRVESVHTVPVPKCFEPPFVAVRSGDEFDARTVVEDLGPRVGNVRASHVLVIVELAVNVEVRRWAFNVVDGVCSPFVDYGDIGEHPHPAETDDSGPIFLYRVHD